MVAGAGSGKTTSLIKGLAAVIEHHGKRLLQRRQRIACITYTDGAANEIRSELSNDRLIHVSTIHSFLWTLAQPFQVDIRKWVDERIGLDMQDLDNASQRARVRATTIERNKRRLERLAEQRRALPSVERFTYGIGSNYAAGVLGHDDIIKMVPQLITQRTLLQNIFGHSYPFCFVDESQDTMETVVGALKAVEKSAKGKFCLGFFGDPMQKIYLSGIGSICREEGWATIEKPENFRCPLAVLCVANAIRRGGDGLVQTPARTAVMNDKDELLVGNAHFFILTADQLRDRRIEQVREWAARRCEDAKWRVQGAQDEVKILVIVHRMAANRLGFGALYSALNDNMPDAYKTGFLDGTTWVVRPFLEFVLPVAEAARQGNKSEVLKIVLQKSPLLDRKRLRNQSTAKQLQVVDNAVTRITEMLREDSTFTIGDVVCLLQESGVVTMDPRFENVRPENAPAGGADDGSSGNRSASEIELLRKFFACRAAEFWGYRDYLQGSSPFSTQHGVKGAQFERVLVIADDEEGVYSQFSYEKYLGVKPPSETDVANENAGKDTTAKRTMRLFYVCCTRALKDLIVVLLTSNVSEAKKRVEEMGIFPPESIHLQEELEEMESR